MDDQESQCENCTNRRICTLIDNSEVGWCQECNDCSLCGVLPVAYRVEWAIDCNFQLRLCEDVCEQCVDKTPNNDDYQCAKTSKNRTVHLYHYEKNIQESSVPSSNLLTSSNV